MSIADKLTTVAENQQKVYDAGHTKGYGEGYSNGHTSGRNEGFVEGYALGEHEAIERYCPVLTDSGAVVTCNPVENYPLNVVSGITPIQAGSGDASPTNIRPITAHTAVKVTRCGKNMFDITRLLVSNGSNSWAVDEDGVYYGIPRVLYDNYHGSLGGFLKGCFKPNTRYTIRIESKCPTRTEGTLMFVAYYTDGTYNTIAMPQKNTDYVVTTGTTSSGKTLDKLGISINYNAMTYVKSISFCEGTVAIDEPYQGDTFTVQLGQDAYCGNLDQSTGVLTLTHECVTFTGKENSWVQYSDSAIVNYTFFTNSESTYYLGGWSSHSDPKKDDVSMRIINAGGGVRVGNMTTFWGLADNTVETWKAYLQAQVAAGTPVQVVNKLKTPITVQLTPQEILSLSSTNTVYCDTGDTTVTFKADPIALVGQLEESIISLGGEI